MQFTVLISGLTFRITCRHDGIRNEMKDFLCDDVADAISVSPTEEDIAYEKESGESSSDYICEKFAVLRKIAEIALDNNRMLIHGACIEYRGKGFFFTAPSGTGKTTHVLLWKDYLGDDVRIINGDKPIFSFGDPITVYGTPWGGKEGYYLNDSVPLSAVIVMKQGSTNSIERLSAADAFLSLYGQAYLGNADKNATARILTNMKKIVQKVPVYRLTCDISEEAFRCSYDELMKL